MDFDLEPLMRLTIAAVLSLPVGLEREISGKPAGVRTHLLLASATAALGWLSIAAAEGDSGADPTRIASYTVAGIGFLGAGLIVAVRGRVHGLTTAVAAFTVMTVGLLCGMGHEEVAVALTFLSLVTLGPVEWLKPRTYGKVIRSVATFDMIVSDVGQIATVQKAVAASKVGVQAVDYTPLDGGHVAVHLTVRGREQQIDAAVAAVRDLSTVETLALVAHSSDVAD